MEGGIRGAGLILAGYAGCAGTKLATVAETASEKTA